MRIVQFCSKQLQCDYVWRVRGQSSESKELSGWLVVVGCLSDGGKGHETGAATVGTVFVGCTQPPGVAGLCLFHCMCCLGVFKLLLRLLFAVPSALWVCVYLWSFKVLSTASLPATPLATPRQMGLHVVNSCLRHHCKPAGAQARDVAMLHLTTCHTQAPLLVLVVCYSRLPAGHSIYVRGCVRCTCCCFAHAFVVVVVFVVVDAVIAAAVVSRLHVCVQFHLLPTICRYRYASYVYPFACVIWGASKAYCTYCHVASAHVHACITTCTGCVDIYWVCVYHQFHCNVSLPC